MYLEVRYSADFTEKLEKPYSEIWFDVINDKADKVLDLISKKDCFRLGVFVSQAESFYHARVGLAMGDNSLYNINIAKLADSFELEFFGESYSSVSAMSILINDYVERNYPNLVEYR